MKTLSTVCLALALPLASATVFAADRDVNADVLAGLTPMNTQELDAVTGGSICIVCALSNKAYVSQANVSFFSAFTKQKNNSVVLQNNN